MNKSKNVSLEGKLLTYQQAAEKANIGINTVARLARESGALVKIGRIARVNWDVLFDYIIMVYQVD